MECVALVMAAGSGLRLGRERPKQYQALAGLPMLRRTIDALRACPELRELQVVIGAGQDDLYDAATRGLELPPPVIGGATRQASVRRGLEALARRAPTHVLVHDAARPFASPALVGRVRQGLASARAVLPVLPVVDTLKRVDANGDVVAEMPRDGLGRAQTPQGFDFATLLLAHRRHADRDCTDDAGVVALDGVPVLAVAGEEENFKVTTEADMARAEALLARQPRRWISGSGFDVHAFAPGRPLVLCGITLPHDRGLAGHSDADVALHAVTDALLGGIAEGDIGSHFPPSDPRWRDVASAHFLHHATGLVRARGGRIEHVDLTIIGERPKIGPHRDTLRASLAGLLALDPGRVSVKATTTERLGFCGREEGLAAQATVSLSFPL
ncbi:MAG: bifunctional 2-C-methyl-D-erythritol 4-phosphate cytidylyltransferase/2-C-methyl-D-erythritol 2,4-cyclodiphosphate synthase [Geminicoccaceae bacterium]|mgnify:CR=1 FL=1|nr:bifunctional 2-C-methyl-D-erythritol 4-phosphate cytidylyltransferase/2-C-methyl-D-erythritol 2,4-cyclodiphosphate synthase [Geminicoccaceae bacterium]HRY24637.1 bifunctional 2-C-methyl-D-erythritol 4-phosphate cytidylyltransferase/2-C-methyl-D-erythritol 2,4-cyclodiphosphate synthase [Geminicoccaceae bacterium]